ncbi:extracellular solute-binding protein [Cohnella sp. CFH 77786]|uniref:extracellular solute-binding protein n=1 Tax=Cohnella sp. CFH 77786 TaxID=2662265 RepID=UPI001C610352|nr:extracellular solute-binding protein [Cohnella sp. CFH 77786]MBW5445172.1 extracellular solute-binding protein [Cohnella sp. CFH 77786]
MTKFKKLKVLTVLALAGAVALTGCSSSKKNESSNGASPAESAAATNSAVPAEPVKLTWFADASFWNPPQPWSTDPNTVEGVITQKTGLTFEFNIPAQDAGTKLNLMLATSQDLPDIMTITDGELHKKLINSGKIWDLDEFMKKYNPSSPLLTSFPADVKKSIIRNYGAFAAIPSHINSPDLQKIYPAANEIVADSQKYSTNNNAMFNEKIMKEAGISVDDLKTEDGVLAAFEKVKNLKVDGAPVIPLQINGKVYQSATLPTLSDHFGAMGVDKDGNYRDGIFAPETKHAIEFLFKAAKGGYFDPAQMTQDDAAMKAAVMSGRVFCFIGNVAQTGMKEKGNPGPIWINPGPIQSNQGTKPVAARWSEPYAGWMQTSISKTAKHPERIAKWIDFMMSDEGKALLFFGFEGKDYNVQNGLFVRTEQGKKNQDDRTKTGIDMFWEFANTAWTDHVTPPPTDPLDVMVIKVGTAAVKASTLYDATPLGMPQGFFPPDSKEAKAEADIKLYREAQISKIILSKDEAAFNKNYDEMISKIKELGQLELDAKKNEQFHKQEQEMGITVKAINP